MKLSRVWAMPNSNTFMCEPIRQMVVRYLKKSSVSIDPFARDSELATYTNDLNPDTKAKYHLDALEFLKLMHDRGVRADLVLFDPPYSLTQMKECYENIGRKISGRESQRFYGDMRNAIDMLLSPGGIVLSFGWNSIGMGKQRGYEIIEIMLVCHGRAHNDTVCVADIKRASKML